MFKLDLEKGEGPEIIIANLLWIIEKAREFQKNSLFCFIDYGKAFVLITTNCRKFLRRWEYQTTFLTCLLRNPYAGQEVTVRTRRGTIN